MSSALSVVIPYLMVASVVAEVVVAVHRRLAALEDMDDEVVADDAHGVGDVFVHGVP